MTLRKNRSKSVKRVFRRTPSGRVSTLFKAGKHKPARCRLCGALLGGVKLSRRVAKSEKVPSRIFAGQLCPACVSDVVKAKARMRAGVAKLADFGLRQREFISMVRKA